jgi:Transposase DDE domain
MSDQARAHRHRRQRSRHQTDGGPLARPGGGGPRRCRLYRGEHKRPELADRDVSWNIAIKRSIIKALPRALRELAEPMERALAQVRAWVEHPFHVIKNLFRHKKLRYRGLAKNTAQLRTLFVKKAHRLGDAYVRAAANFCFGWT